jgi:hypothetical protein
MATSRAPERIEANAFRFAASSQLFDSSARRSGSRGVARDRYRPEGERCRAPHPEMKISTFLAAAGETRVSVSLPRPSISALIRLELGSKLSREDRLAPVPYCPVTAVVLWRVDEEAAVD